MPTITFLGAARTVTGLKYLLELDGSRLLVDCGLFQGLKELRERNWQTLPVDAATIDAVILTHAHLDHCGYLPRLVAEGFTGRIFCTQGTGSLCRIVLPDAGRLQEEDAELANKHGYSKHTPALPLFTEEDANRALVQLQLIGYDRPVPVADGVEATFINAGHLLGSSYVQLTFGNGRRRTLLFGGDLGRYDRPVLPDPTPVTGADVLLVESTYGDRLHPPAEEEEKLAAVVNETIKGGGKLIIPSFAIGRVEEVLYWLRRLEEEKRIPQVPVFLDSPMAARAREQYSARLDELDPEIREASEHCAGAPARRAPGVRVLHGAVPGGVVPEAVASARRVEGAGDHRLVERHGVGRAGPAPPAGRAARRAAHGALRRLPGRRHARPPAARRRPRGEDPRRDRARARADRADRLHVGARRRRRDPALARRLRAAARHDLPRPRRAGGDGGARGDDRPAAGLAHDEARAQANR